MKKQLLQAMGIGLLTIGAVSLSVAESKLDPKLPTYEKASGVSGNLSSVGSDTLANLMTLWTEQFSKSYPNVNIQVQAAGSSTAPPALTEGTSNLGPMSRKMKDKEIQAFEKKYGYKPTAIPVAIDADANPSPKSPAAMLLKNTDFISIRSPDRLIQILYNMPIVGQQHDNRMKNLLQICYSIFNCYITV